MILAEDADPGFAKVAKQKAKFLSQERLKASASRPAHRRGGFHPYAAPTAPSTSGGVVQPLMSPTPFRQGFDKSKLRCNYCKDLGHFVRECPKTPQAQASAPK